VKSYLKPLPGRVPRALFWVAGIAVTGLLGAIAIAMYVD